ncbi:hypothetical protein EDC96DRAFT_563359 [Choanephora cucurbitarum]|nr:hypothetical protein EDC96DRAFT_563359 [Choanephora cucurbitarum]
MINPALRIFSGYLGAGIHDSERLLENTARVLEEMQISHEENAMKMMMGAKSSSNLLDYVNIDIQTPQKGAGYGILLPKEYIVVNYHICCYIHFSTVINPYIQRFLIALNP